MIRPIVPKFTASSANTTIELGTAPIELKTGSITATGLGKARLEMAGKERVIVEIETNFAGYMFGDETSLQMKFGQHGQFIPVTVVQSQIGNTEMKMWVMADGSAFTQIRDGRVRLRSAILHILNFPDFCCLGGENTDFRQDGRRLGRVILRHSDWEIELQALSSTHSIVEQLKANGGNAITHVARITRWKGRAFTCKHLDGIVRDLQRFLSFARGAWTSVFGTVGFDKNGNEVYEDWSQRMASPWQVCRGWFDIHHGETLAVVFPAFVKLIRDPTLGSAGYAALHWYLRSNRAGEGAGVDGGLILSQAALEGLSKSVLRNAGVALSNKSKAADRIRAACMQLNIQTEIPSHSKKLRRWQRNGAFSDGPEAVTRVRNELVHPKRLLPGKLPLIVPDAWQLAQWYIEVMLLRLCQYEGVYSHRLKAKWVGEVQPFP